MNFVAIEKWFVDSFFLPERTDRARGELGKPARRRSFFSKLCHSYDQYIDSKYYRSVQGFDWEATRKIARNQFLFELDINQWFVMAYEEKIDRTFVSVDEARYIHNTQRMPVIYISAYRYAYFQAEFEKKLPKFLLDVSLGEID